MATCRAKIIEQVQDLHKRQSAQVYDEVGVDRTPKQLVQRQMVPVRPPQQAALPSLLPSGMRVAGGSILGCHHWESRMSSRVSKLSERLTLP